MAHVAKYSASAAGHLTKHYERGKNENGDYIKFGNESIDLNRTHENYNLSPERNCNQIDFLNQRLSEIKVQKRADVNVMCSWVVTLPKDAILEKSNESIRKKQEKAFFEITYDFLSQKYGEKNVISSYVHIDEKQPHMHFAFIPVVPDRRWNEKNPMDPRDKVSAKECLTKAELKGFHDELQSYVDEKIGKKNIFKILNESTRNGNKSIEILKRGSAVETLNKMRDEYKEIKNLKWCLNAEIADLRREKEKLIEELDQGEKTLKITEFKCLDAKKELKIYSQKVEIVKKILNDLYLTQIDDLRDEKNKAELDLTKSINRVKSLNLEVKSLEERMCDIKITLNNEINAKFVIPEDLNKKANPHLEGLGVIEKMQLLKNSESAKREIEDLKQKNREEKISKIDRMRKIGDIEIDLNDLVKSIREQEGVYEKTKTCQINKNDEWDLEI